MGSVIGIDTGGTYTDAVILDKRNGVVQKKAKAITVPHDLSIGIEEAINALGEVDFNEVEMVSISTTLATNAIVEGRGGRVALLLIGYDKEVIEQRGLEKRLPVEALYYIAGGHDVKGEEIQALDTEGARGAILEIRDRVDAFAVSGYFSVMNPEHENRLYSLIRELTSAPVVCGHELTNKLNAIKRVFTAVLNARLLPLIQHLLDSVVKVLEQKGCHAPLMVVKGDGTLISEEQARQRPVETILSGPAASAVGAQFLADQRDAIVVDMGGTTTDIAILEKGLPWSNPSGATVGGWQTSVQAADLRTIGIGGDSHIRVGEDHTMQIGPRRAIPLFRLGAECAEIVSELEKLALVNWEGETIQPTDYVTLVNQQNDLAYSQMELMLIDMLNERPLPRYRLPKMLGNSIAPLERLEMLGVVQRSGLTPTDVLWSETMRIDGCGEAAQAGSKVVAQQLNITEDNLKKKVLDQVVEAIAREILDKLIYDMTNQSLYSASRAWERLLGCLLGYDPSQDISGFIQVQKPIVAIGAPVESYIPQVAERLHTRCVIPPHAEVGNAVGAAVASITHTVEILIQPNVIGSGTLTYLVHSPNGREVLPNLDEAVTRAESLAKDIALQRLRQSGATSYSVTLDQHVVKLGKLSEVTVRAYGTDQAIKARNKPSDESSE